MPILKKKRLKNLKIIPNEFNLKYKHFFLLFYKYVFV